MSMYKTAAVLRGGYQGGPGIGTKIIGGISRLTGVISGGLKTVAPYLGPAAPIAQIGSKVYGGISKATGFARPGGGGGGLPALPGAGGGGAMVPRSQGSFYAPGCPSLTRWPTTKSGAPRRVKKNGCPWKRPTMNFGNGRAIKRAARRLEGAEKLFRRVLTIRHGTVGGKIVPKKGRKHG